MRANIVLVVALVWGTLLFTSSARVQGGSPGAGSAAELSGRWVSTEYVSFTNPSHAGSSFFLDIVIAKDGTFQGVWDAYICNSYPGAYSTSIISCSRVKKPAKVRGKFNLTSGSGEIELERAGRSSFRYTLGPKLKLELPKNWLKQGDPVLFTSQLERKSRQAADAQTPGQAGTAVTLRESERKMTNHPTVRHLSANIGFDGLVLWLRTVDGHHTKFTFLAEAFPLNAPCAILLPGGSQDLLPLLVTRVGANDYRVEWLKAPPTAGFQKIVKYH